MSDGDGADVQRIMRDALQWEDSEKFENFFRWKHRENPFGQSPAWVAEADGKVVGFRTFMRWRFVTPNGEVDAVRAVDTATDPNYRGLGVFRTLTLHALDELAKQKVGFVFNTPNAQSLPGYLKMGWQPVGRLPISVMLPNAVGARRMLAARAPAQLWSERTSVGELPGDVFADASLMEYLLGLHRSVGLATKRDAAFLAWRYGLEQMCYRVIINPRDASGGALVFRLRRRGAAIEAAICDAFVPSRSAGRSLTRRLLGLTRAHYAISLGSDRFGIPLPRQGPLLTYRPIVSSDSQGLSEWVLTLGDVELF